MGACAAVTGAGEEAAIGLGDADAVLVLEGGGFVLGERRQKAEVVGVRAEADEAGGERLLDFADAAVDVLVEWV